MTAEYKISLAALDIDTAPPAAMTVLEKAKAQVGFIPNMYKGMVNYPELLETYLGGYARFRKSCSFNPVEQELIFLTISRANGCGYCIAAHSMIAERSKMPADVLQAIRSGSNIPDGKLAALRQFAQIMVESRGMPSRSDAQAFLAAGYNERQMLEIILVIAVKTISNFSNHLFHTELDPSFAAHAM